MDTGNNYSLTDIVNYLIKSNLEDDLRLKKEGIGQDQYSRALNITGDSLTDYMLRRQESHEERQNQLYDKLLPFIESFMKEKFENLKSERAARQKELEMNNWTNAIRSLTPLFTLILQARHQQQSDPFTALVNSTFSGFRIPQVPNPFQQAQGMMS
jgi:hypothetical protein